LHRLVDHGQQLGGERVQVHVVVQADAEAHGHLASIMAAPVEPAVDQLRDVAGGRLEQHGRRQRRSGHGQAGASGQQPAEAEDRQTGGAHQPGVGQGRGADRHGAHDDHEQQGDHRGGQGHPAQLLAFHAAGAAESHHQGGGGLPGDGLHSTVAAHSRRASVDFGPCRSCRG
jgi:hypothetical protein